MSVSGPRKIYVALNGESTQMKVLFCILAFAALAFGQAGNFAFTYELGDPVPPPQTWYLTSQSAADSVNGLAAVVTSGHPWLLASLSASASPAVLTISIDPQGLAVGTYSGSILVTSSSTAPGLNSSVVGVSLTVRRPIVSLSGVSNAALPALDAPGRRARLAPRSIATVYGIGLADIEAFTASPGTKSLGGTEVHLATDDCFDSSCDLVADLIYVSTAQINFLVPDITLTAPAAYRLVFVRDGQRVDEQSCAAGGTGCLILDPSGTADRSVVFQAGYDCLYSASQSDAAACGLSWIGGQDRAPLGAITDALTGELISSSNPVYQGRLITLWMTGLAGGVSFDTHTGLFTASAPAPIAFGVAYQGSDLTTGFMSPMPLWAGESPQFPGLDQVNVAFPGCGAASPTPNVTPRNICTNCTGTSPTGAGEKRLDAFLAYTNSDTGTTARIYLPFSVRAGDPACSW